MAPEPSADPEGAPLPTPPDAVATTVEELPAGFWDDEGLGAPPAPRDRTPTRTTPHDATPPPTPAPPPTRAAAAPTAPDAVGDTTPALAALQGLALLQAVFPGRVVKVERAAVGADAGVGDAVADEPAAEPLDAPGDGFEHDDDDPPPPSDPPRRDP